MNADRDEARRLLEAILAAKPERDAARFSACVRALVRWRDGLAAEGGREPLSTVNAILAAVLGGQYPGSKVPWERLQAACTTLDALP